MRWNLGFNRGSAGRLIERRLVGQRRYPLARLLAELRRLVSDPEDRIRWFTQHGEVPRTRQNCTWIVTRRGPWIAIRLRPRQERPA